MSASPIVSEDKLQNNNPTNSVVLQVVSALAITGFTAFMANGWYRQLSQLSVAEQIKVQQETTKSESTKLVSTTTEVTEIKDVPEIQVISAITDAAVVEELQGKLYQQIDETWRTNPSFDKSLVYQVKVNEDGAIADYTSINQTASEYIDETPLPILTGEISSTIAQQPLAEFLVVLTPRGVLEVSPWLANN